MSMYFHWAELPPKKNVYTYAETTRWDNHNLYPIPKKERTYGWLAFFAYWVPAGVNVINFTVGSANIAFGLNAAETLGAVLLGRFIAAANAWLCARPGQD
jgi:NCS1 family nucleobase:cation symporter-1